MQQTVSGVDEKTASHGLPKGRGMKRQPPPDLPKGRGVDEKVMS